MISYSKNKKGQAAIEFLMTYGWMLLVVLIVGALIFSFVDFGALLPNNLDLNNGFRQLSPDKITAYASTNNVSFAVSYISSSLGRVNVTPVSGEETVKMTVAGGVYTCTIDTVENSDTGIRAIKVPGNDSVNFINGQIAVFTFDCDAGPSLVSGDVIDGEVKVTYSDPKINSLKLTSAGSIRVTIED